jgi:hypothetical protein
LKLFGVIDEDGKGGDQGAIRDDILHDIRWIERVGLVNFYTGIRFFDRFPLEKGLLLGRA